MIFRDDFENMTEEEIGRQKVILDLIHKSMGQEKVMIYALETPELVREVVGMIDNLMKSQGDVYSISYGRCEVFGTSLYIVLETPYFGGALNQKMVV